MFKTNSFHCGTKSHILKRLGPFVHMNCKNHRMNSFSEKKYNNKYVLSKVTLFLFRIRF